MISQGRRLFFLLLLPLLPLALSVLLLSLSLFFLFLLLLLWSQWYIDFSIYPADISWVHTVNPVCFDYRVFEKETRAVCLSGFFSLVENNSKNRDKHEKASDCRGCGQKKMCIHRDEEHSKLEVQQGLGELSGVSWVCSILDKHRSKISSGRWWS